MAIEVVETTPIQDLIEFSVTNGGTYEPVGRDLGYPHNLVAMAARQSPSRIKWLVDRAFPELFAQRHRIRIMAGLEQEYKLPAGIKLDI